MARGGALRRPYAPRRRRPAAVVRRVRSLVVDPRTRRWLVPAVARAAGRCSSSLGSRWFASRGRRPCGRAGGSPARSCSHRSASSRGGGRRRHGHPPPAACARRAPAGGPQGVGAGCWSRLGRHADHHEPCVYGADAEARGRCAARPSRTATGTSRPSTRPCSCASPRRARRRCTAHRRSGRSDTAHDRVRSRVLADEDPLFAGAGCGRRQAPSGRGVPPAARPGAPGGGRSAHGSGRPGLRQRGADVCGLSPPHRRAGSRGARRRRRREGRRRREHNEATAARLGWSRTVTFVEARHRRRGGRPRSGPARRGAGAARVRHGHRRGAGARGALAGAGGAWRRPAATTTCSAS